MMNYNYFSEIELNKPTLQVIPFEEINIDEYMSIYNVNI